MNNEIQSISHPSCGKGTGDGQGTGDRRKVTAPVTTKAPVDKGTGDWTKAPVTDGRFPVLAHNQNAPLVYLRPSSTAMAIRRQLFVYTLAVAALLSGCLYSKRALRPSTGTAMSDMPGRPAQMGIR
jgi:hypothetical protein